MKIPLISYSNFILFFLFISIIMPCSAQQSTGISSRIVDVNLSSFPSVDVLFRVDSQDRRGIHPLNLEYTFSRTAEIAVEKSRDPAQIIMAFDKSESMKSMWEKIVAQSSLVMKELGERDKAILYTFSERKELLENVARRTYPLHEKLVPIVPDGSTHLYDCLAFLARKVPAGKFTHRFITLFSDGKDQIGSHSLSRASILSAEQSAEELREASISLVAMTVSDEANTRPLKMICDITGGTLEALHTGRTIKDAFRFIQSKTGFSNLITFNDPFYDPGNRILYVNIIFAGDLASWKIPFHSDSNEVELNLETLKAGNVSWQPQLLSGAGDSRRLYIRGTDNQGRSVSLKKNDITIIVSASGKGKTMVMPKPLKAAVLLDSSKSMEAHFQEAQTLFASILDSITREVEIRTFHFATKLIPVPLERIDIITTDIKAGGSTAFYDCMADAALRIADERSRTAIIAVTDGKDQASINSNVQLSRTSQQELINILKGLDIPVYFASQWRGTRHSVLRTLSRQSGGAYHYAENSEKLWQNLSESFNSRITEGRPCKISWNFKWPCGDRVPLLLTVKASSPSSFVECCGLLEPNL